MAATAQAQAPDWPQTEAETELEEDVKQVMSMSWSSAISNAFQNALGSGVVISLPNGGFCPIVASPNMRAGTVRQHCGCSPYDTTPNRRCAGHSGRWWRVRGIGKISSGSLGSSHSPVSGVECSHVRTRPKQPEAGML